jgi:hypothetical protein
MRLNGVSPNIDIVPFNNDIDTLERAVKERVFFVKNLDKKSCDKFVPPPRPAAGLFAERMEGAFAVLKKFLPSTAPVSHQQFVDGTPSRKRKLYQDALDTIRLDGLNLERDSSVSVFVKFEKTDRTSKADPVPRVISPRDPKFNIALGRYLKPIEERIFKALGRMFGHVTVMKGMDTDRTAAVIKQKWDMFTSPVAVGLDASRFDQHVSIDALKFEHQVYLECFKTKKHKKKLKNILKMQENNRCVGRTPDGDLAYTIEGTRMSGDMNTSLGNCVLMCTMIKAYALHKGLNLQLANNGDDCVVFMEKRDLGAFSDGLFEWFLQLGFNMAIEAPSWSLEEIEFCQCRPVFDGTKYTMCRNPLTAIAKDSVYLKSDVFFATYDAWLDAVGTGGLAMAGGLPVFNSFYSMYQRNGKKTWYSKRRHRNRTLEGVDDVLPWFMRQTGLSGRREARDPTPESRASFYYAWGVTPDEQVELEKYYDHVSLDTSTLMTLPFAPRRIFVEPEDCQ